LNQKRLVFQQPVKGELLVDAQTMKYRELPAKTNVYLNLNSYNYKHFKFDLGLTKEPEFPQAYKFFKSGLSYFEGGQALPDQD